MCLFMASLPILKFFTKKSSGTNFLKFSQKLATVRKTILTISICSTKCMYISMFVSLAVVTLSDNFFQIFFEKYFWKRTEHAEAILYTNIWSPYVCVHMCMQLLLDVVSVKNRFFQKLKFGRFQWTTRTAVHAHIYTHQHTYVPSLAVCVPGQTSLYWTFYVIIFSSGR